MREYFNSCKVANTVRMLRAGGNNGAIVLVEGDDDARWLRKFLSTRCRLLPAFGKALAIEALREVEALGGILAVVDADFDHLLERALPSANVLRTDAHDVECMLLASGALEQVLAELGSAEKIASFVQTRTSIRAALLAAARPVGVFLLAILPDHLHSDVVFTGLSVSKLKFGEILNHETFLVDLPALVREVKNRSQRQDIAEHDAVARLQAHCERHESTDPWQLCRGHDLCAILLHGLCGAFGSAKPSQLTQERLEGSLRLAYSQADFSKTKLCADLLLWGSGHPEYPLLD